MKAIGLNRAEVFCRGQYLEAPELPAKLGYEAAGVVTAVGPDVGIAAIEMVNAEGAMDVLQK